MSRKPTSEDPGRSTHSHVRANWWARLSALWRRPAPAKDKPPESRPEKRPMQAAPGGPPSAEYILIRSELHQLFQGHPAARRMFPRLWLLARAPAPVGDEIWRTAALTTLAGSLRELDQLLTAQSPRGLQLLRQKLVQELAERDRRLVAGEDTRNEVLSRLGEERLQVGEASFEAFAKEEKAWRDTRSAGA